MAAKFKISDHAARRFHQRFRHIDSSLESLVEKSVMFGGQRGSEYLLLNQDHEIVFPVVRDSDELEHTVKTVLTLQQAKANLSLFHKIDFESDASKRVEEIRKKAEEERKKEEEESKRKKESEIDAHDPRISEENIKKLKVLAREFVKKYGYFPSGDERKKTFREIKEMLPVSNRNLTDYFLCEIGRLLRERQKKKGF